ncbi:transcription elongation factor A protein 2-like [Hibiscus syriacus]|uniref:Transcription elongation factor A protein 2-like n=1 Tax=Hibiscus syriacus TaxID=106335 RepID=A0A6A3CH05_HIBSY|nr:transcription termination factor MTEF18, mitochondrial-like [Hibiscus syriacus]KAE8726598.1 transcription elongation factor A protein 2-like [Hibiscus syriacus]
MTHFRNLRNPATLNWVSSHFVENQLKPPFLELGLSHIAQRQNPRLYRTKGSVVTEACDGLDVAKIPRATLKEAQAALLEYLHCTRNIPFMDAEIMSKNSPDFLRNLLKRVNIANDVGSSMRRFLCYHPINEFEPFFESLGLKPCEYAPFLHRDLMFLSDDSLLLANYRVLCRFGIERNKIGLVYKKAVQVFQLEFGVLPLKLQAYQELGLSDSFMVKIIVCSPCVLIGDVDMKFIKVLEILRSMGFDYAWIKEHLSEQDSYNWSMILRVLNFFREMCCSSELVGLISQHPGLLFESSGYAVFSLIAFLLKFGLPIDQISSMFLLFPKIQVRHFVSNLIRSFLLFREIEMEVDEIGKIVRSYPILLGSHRLKKANSLLSHLNVGKKRLCKYIQENPQELSKWGTGSRVEPLPNSGEDMESQRLKMKFFLDLGYGENPDMMKKAFKVFRGRGKELQERFDSIVNAGLDKAAVSEMVSVSPQILNQSKAVIQSKIDVLANELGYPLSSLVTFPSFLSYTTQRVRLRLAMYNWLKDHKKADPDLALSTIVACSDKVFMNQYVNHHPSGPLVWQDLKAKFSMDD